MIVFVDANKRQHILSNSHCWYKITVALCNMISGRTLSDIVSFMHILDQF